MRLSVRCGLDQQTVFAGRRKSERVSWRLAATRNREDKMHEHEHELQLQQGARKAVQRAVPLCRRRSETRGEKQFERPRDCR